ncbi:hypothetical protein [Pseudomonas sp. NPDC090592]|uniref:hypothetical protein n=1 Tax=Pseudomonas sp. NPDC090592 TaxID=3364480 RepID=UPI00383B20B4
MPTENRSSNTEMVSVPFQREDRYVVVKRSDLALLSPVDSDLAHSYLEGVQSLMADWNCPARECLVIESDWPEFAPAWASIEARVAGQPAPKHHPEPIAWMVGTAIWWTKEEAERDSAATGLPIVGLGPITGVASDQRQGEPVAWRGINDLDEVVTEWIDGVPPESMVDLCGNRASFAKIERAYTHADPGEVERLRKLSRKLAQGSKDQLSIIESLRAQLAERDALLREVLEFIDDGVGRSDAEWAVIQKARTALSASAEPSAPAPRPGGSHG